MDELLLSKVRLTIVTELLPAHWLSFTELQKTVDATVGNLSAHLMKLVADGYVEEEKRFIGRRPQTRYRLTPRGRAALVEHISWLNAIIAQQSPEPAESVPVPRRRRSTARPTT